MEVISRISAEASQNKPNCLGLSRILQLLLYCESWENKTCGLLPRSSRFADSSTIDRSVRNLDRVQPQAVARRVGQVLLYAKIFFLCLDADVSK